MSWTVSWLLLRVRRHGVVLALAVPFSIIQYVHGA